MNINKFKLPAIILSASLLLSSCGAGAAESSTNNLPLEHNEANVQAATYDEQSDVNNISDNAVINSAESANTSSENKKEEKDGTLSDIDIYAWSGSECLGIRYSEFSDEYYAIETESDNFSLNDLAHSENLKELTISKLGSKSLYGIEKFPNLEYLKIQDFSISDISNLSECKKLKTLVIRLTDTIEDYSVLSELENLTELTVMLCEDGTTAPNIEAVSKCKNIETLSFQGFTIENIEFISELQKIKELRLWSYKYPVTDISPIAKLSCLEKLEISYNYTSDDIEVLNELPMLKCLSITTEYTKEENGNIKNELTRLLPECDVEVSNF